MSALLLFLIAAAGSEPTDDDSAQETARRDEVALLASAKARQVKREDKAVWRYALARMNADSCEVRLDDKRVQRWERIDEPWRIHKAPYTLLGFKPESVKLEPNIEK